MNIILLRKAMKHKSATQEMVPPYFELVNKKKHLDISPTHFTGNLILSYLTNTPLTDAFSVYRYTFHHSNFSITISFFISFISPERKKGEQPFTEFLFSCSVSEFYGWHTYYKQCLFRLPFLCLYREQF